jgi:hypothetical protein
MLQPFLNFIANQLIIIHTGVWYAKLKSSFLIGATLSPIALILQKLTDWYITNQVTIFFFCGAIMADWLFGTWKHIKLKTFSWKLNGLGLLVKLGMVVGGSFLSEALPHFLGNDNILSNSTLTILRLSIFMYPAGSCWMNMSVITNGAFPPLGWINKIKSFNENLNIKDLADGSKD